VINNSLKRESDVHRVKPNFSEVDRELEVGIPI
jgi:hypothetical protein